MSNVAPPLVDLYAPVRQDLSIVERIFDEELVSGVQAVATLCDGLRAYRGKMLRPALLLLSGKATGGVSPAHHTLAAVVEMVHVATLVHDDVLDKADERRRQPTVSATDGNVAAVLLGDYLISHAFHLCSSLDSQHAARRIGATTNTVCEGELQQNHHRGDAGLCEADYLDVVERKTAALTATACELGAHYAGADVAQVRALREYGTSAGIAFQIVDDILDITGDRAAVGKTLGCDFELGKPTLAVIHCLANARPSTANSLRRALSGEASADAAALRSWLDETASLDYARSSATAYVERAVQCLDTLPASDARESLIAMAGFILRRQF